MQFVRSAEKKFRALFFGRTSELCGDESDSGSCKLWLVHHNHYSQADRDLPSWDPAVLEKHCSCSSQITIRVEADKSRASGVQFLTHTCDGQR